MSGISAHILVCVSVKFVEHSLVHVTGVSVLYFNMGVCIVPYGTEWYTLSWWWECVHMRVCTPHYVQQYSVVWLWVSSNCS